MNSNSFGSKDAAIRRYSIGFSTRVIRTVSSPYFSKSSANAVSNAVLMRVRAPCLRPPLLLRPPSLFWNSTTLFLLELQSRHLFSDGEQ